MSRLAALTFSLLFVAIAHGQPLKDIESRQEEVERQQRFEDAFKAVENLEKALQRSVDEFKLECTKAVGPMPVCDCLAKQRPVSHNFLTYAISVIRAKDLKEDKSLSRQERELIDNAVSARDRCIAKK